MEPNPDQRADARSCHEASIMFEHYPSGMYFEGRMFNYSMGGMYFEANFAPEIGSEIFIGVENSPNTSGHEVYRAKVVWKRRLRDRQSLFLHGIGVKYF
jgi:Tfp pilus assembly protein PilZ